MKSSTLKIAAFLLLVGFLSSSCVNVFKLVDLRTDQAKAQNDPDRAKALMTSMAIAHGIANWEKLETYTMEFSDRFVGFIGKSGNPFQQDSLGFTLHYIPNTFDGRLEFYTPQKGKTAWGVQSWQSYTQTADGQPVFTKDKDILFWLPTYQYFTEFPRRIQNANAFAYAGEATIEGVACEGILASWNQVEPQRHIDQYLIWLDKETKRIVKLEYTIRDLKKFLSGAVYFKDYQNFNGLLLPTYLPVESNLTKKGYIHEMRLHSFTGDEVEPATIRINPNLPLMGDQKSE